MIMIFSAKYPVLIIIYALVSLTSSCEIWKATDCTGQPTPAEEELMESDDYTKEQLYKFCDKGKAYVDCVNAKLKCCDMKPEMRNSLIAYDRQLEKVAWKLGAYCAGIGINNVIQYKCRTTTARVSLTTTTTKVTKPTLQPCPIERVSDTCSHLLDGKVKFEEDWTIYDKMQWCRDAIDYVTCSSQFLINCNISINKYEIDQLQTFIDYITKSANIYCPGGIQGCENSVNDVRCRLGARYFLGEYTLNTDAAIDLKSCTILIALLIISILFF